MVVLTKSDVGSDVGPALPFQRNLLFQHHHGYLLGTRSHDKECNHTLLAQQVVGPVDRLAVTFEDL